MNNNYYNYDKSKMKYYDGDDFNRNSTDFVASDKYNIDTYTDLRFGKSETLNKINNRSEIKQKNDNNKNDNNNNNNNNKNFLLLDNESLDDKYIHPSKKKDDKDELWNNTKRKNLDYSHYNMPSSQSNTGFGDVELYGKLLYGGEDTRQLNKKNNIREKAFDKIDQDFRHYVRPLNIDTENIRCGDDTRNANKKTIKKCN